MGRPRLPRKEKFGKIYGTRFRPDDEREILKAIEASGKSQADWIRDTLLAAARR